MKTAAILKFRQSWYSMKLRCYDPEAVGYKRYGGRGIKVCERWMDYENYYDDMFKDFQRHLAKYGARDTSIDRINVDGDYCKENCRWSTQKEQQRNRSNNRVITLHGHSRTTAEWCEVMGYSANTILRRLSTGWSEERAVLTPINKPFMYKGETATEATKRLNGKRGLVQNRLNRYWPVKDAFNLPIGCEPVTKLKH